MMKLERFGIHLRFNSKLVRLEDYDKNIVTLSSERFNSKLVRLETKYSIHYLGSISQVDFFFDPKKYIQ